MAPQFKTSSAQSLATRARAIPDLEATAHIYLQPASTEKLPHLKAEGMYVLLFLLLCSLSYKLKEEKKLQILKNLN